MSMSMFMLVIWGFDEASTISHERGTPYGRVSENIKVRF